eukprot:EG_transcript_32185
MFRTRALQWFNAQFFGARFDLKGLVPPIWSGMTGEKGWHRYPLHFVVAVGQPEDVVAALDQAALFTGQCGRDLLPAGKVTVDDWRQDTLETPLDFAVQRGDPAIVRLLLDRGATPSPLTMRLAAQGALDARDAAYAQRMARLLEKVPPPAAADEVRQLVADAYAVRQHSGVPILPNLAVAVS